MRRLFSFLVLTVVALVDSSSEQTLGEVVPVTRFTGKDSAEPSDPSKISGSDSLSIILSGNERHRMAKEKRKEISDIPSSSKGMGQMMGKGQQNADWPPEFKSSAPSTSIRFESNSPSLTLIVPEATSLSTMASSYEEGTTVPSTTEQPLPKASMMMMYKDGMYSSGIGGSVGYKEVGKGKSNESKSMGKGFKMGSKSKHNYEWSSWAPSSSPSPTFLESSFPSSTPTVEVEDSSLLMMMTPKGKKDDGGKGMGKKKDASKDEKKMTKKMEKKTDKKMSQKGMMMSKGKGKDKWPTLAPTPFEVESSSPSSTPNFISPTIMPAESPTIKVPTRPTPTSPSVTTPAPTGDSSGEPMETPTISPGGQDTTTVVVGPYSMEYTIQLTRFPAESDYVGLVEATSTYLNTYLQDAFASETGVTYINSTTYSTRRNFLIGQPIQVDFNTSMVFTSSSDIPSNDKLQTIIGTAFTENQTAAYLQELASLPPSNLFSTTSLVSFIGGQRTATTTVAKRVFPLLAIAAGGCVLLATIGLMLNQRRRRFLKSSMVSARRKFPIESILQIPDDTLVDDDVDPLPN